MYKIIYCLASVVSTHLSCTPMPAAGWNRLGVFLYLVLYSGRGGLLRWWGSICNRLRCK